MVAGKRPTDTIPYYRIVMFRSTDAGLTWSVSDIPIFANYGFAMYTVWKIQMLDSLTAIARIDSAGDKKGFLIRTTDGGITWSKLNTPTYYILEDFDFSDLQTGILISAGKNYNNKIYITTDGGDHWEEHPNTEKSFPLFCKSYGNGMFRVWIYPSGPILSTYNNWTSYISSAVPYDNSGTSKFGYLMGGFAWGKGDTLIGYGAQNYFDTVEGRSVANGSLTRTTDGGKTWTDFPIANSLGSLDQMTGLDHDTLYAPNRRPNRVMLRSLDGGASWARDSIILDTDYTYITPVGITMTASGHPVAIIGSIELDGILVRGEPLQMGVNTRMKINDAPLSELSVFPNPVSTASTISLLLDKPTYVRLELLNVLGEQVSWITDARLSEGSHDIPLDPKQLPNGLYFLRLTEDGSVHNQLVVIDR